MKKIECEIGVLVEAWKVRVRHLKRNGCPEEAGIYMVCIAQIEEILDKKKSRPRQQIPLG